MTEPTSALDPESVGLVEEYLKSKTCIWITHDPRQQERVATHTLTLRRHHSNSFTSDDYDDEDASSSATTIEMNKK